MIDVVQSGIEPWERAQGREFRVAVESWPRSSNLMDRWVLSSVQSLLSFVRTELRAYRLYTVVPRLLRFIDHLVNWYIRMNRSRLRGESAGGETAVDEFSEEVAAEAESVDDATDWMNALHTLVKVLFQLIFMMAPFAPFFTEFIYQRLRFKLDFSNFASLGEYYQPVLLIVATLSW